MHVRKVDAKRRSGATAVEFAFVAIPLFMFFFGTAEYARFYLDRNVLNNAAREGCRYAIVYYYSDGTNINTNVTNQVNSYMAGRKGDFSGGTVTVSLYGNPASNPYLSPATYTGNNVNNLGAGDQIFVQITATYVPILPMPIVPGLPSTIQMTSTCTMTVEGAT